MQKACLLEKTVLYCHQFTDLKAGEMRYVEAGHEL